jgi:hypothetical protein
MRQYPAEEQPTRGQKPTWRGVGIWDHTTVGRQVCLRHWATTAAAGALLPLLTGLVRALAWRGRT